MVMTQEAQTPGSSLVVCRPFPAPQLSQLLALNGFLRPSCWPCSHSYPNQAAPALADRLLASGCFLPAPQHSSQTPRGNQLFRGQELRSWEIAGK